MKNCIKLLTIDLSTRATGVAYFENGIYKKHFLFKPDKKLDIKDRSEDIMKKLSDLINILMPNIVVIEDTYAGKNMDTYKWLTRLQGSIIMSCFEIKAEYHLIHPSTWRKILEFEIGKNVNRDGLKEQSIDYIKNKYDLDVTDDEADSICLGDAYVKYMGSLEEE